MNISPINNNYNKTNALAFGRFADDNARNVVRNALKSDDEFTQSMYDVYFQRIDECDFFEAYTDEETNKVKGRFTDEFVKENTQDNNTYAHRFIKSDIEGLKRRNNLGDLSILKNLKIIAGHISDFQEVLAGIDPSEKCRSTGSNSTPEDDTKNRMFGGLNW